MHSPHLPWQRHLHALGEDLKVWNQPPNTGTHVIFGSVQTHGGPLKKQLGTQNMAKHQMHCTTQDRLGHH